MELHKYAESHSHSYSRQGALATQESNRPCFCKVRKQLVEMNVRLVNMAAVIALAGLLPFPAAHAQTGLLYYYSSK